jgi:hypothetical protein
MNYAFIYVFQLTPKEEDAAKHLSHRQIRRIVRKGSLLRLMRLQILAHGMQFEFRKFTSQTY